MKALSTATPSLLALLLLATPAAASPQLSGTYTFTGTETCQVVTKSWLGALGGRIEQQLGTMTLTPTATGATGRMIIRGYGGRLLDSDGSVGRINRGADVTLTITGDGGAGELTLTQKFPSLTRVTKGLIQFDQTSGTVVLRASIVGVHPQDGASHSDCAAQMLLFRK